MIKAFVYFCVLIQEGEILSRAELGQAVTCLAWGPGGLWAGGAVAVLDPGGGPARQVLSLDSRVVQLSPGSSLLAASCLTGAVICSPHHRTVRPLGRRARRGRQESFIIFLFYLTLYYYYSMS